MSDETGARPMNVTIADLTDDEANRLTPAQREVLSSDRGDLPVSHLSPGYDEPASAEFVDPRDPRVASGEVEATDTTERRDDLPVESVVSTPEVWGDAPEGFEGNGDTDTSLILDDASDDPDIETGPMPALDEANDGSHEH